MKKYYTVLSAFLLLTACSNKIDFETMSAEEIYNYAMDEMEKTRYAKAETAFETLETDHPYSQWAVRSKLMSAYAYYKDEKYDDAVMAVDRFIKYHPGNKDVPYALYLKGMCYYDQISTSDKDQGNTQKAAETFAVLMAMFPDSEYAQDAAGKMNLTEDYKAGQEMVIGRYYLHEGNYLSALNRFNVVLENYQKTIQIEEALYRQVEIYAIFGLNNYANGYFKILQQNYPEGKWTAKAEKVMKKIGVEVKPSKAKSEPKKEQVESATEQTSEVKEESKGWFSGWFGGNKDTAEETKAQVEDEVTDLTEEMAEVEEATETAEEQTQEVQEESKGWFSGWFGGNKDESEKAETKVEDEVTESTEEMAEVEEAVETAEEQTSEVKEESKGWFSGWFGGSEDKAEEAKAKVEDEVTDSAEEMAEVAEAVETAEEQSQEEVQEESKGWFSGWFSSSSNSEDKAEKVIETVKEQKPEVQEESKGWFGGWFGSDEGKKNKVSASPVAKAYGLSDEQISWFGGDEMRADMAQSKKAANDAINESLGKVKNVPAKKPTVIKKASEEAQEAAEDAADAKEVDETATPEDTESGGWFSGLFSGGSIFRRYKAD